VTIKGQSRLLIPKVATGVKQWHLRKESDFYPKAHFNYLMNTIPAGSDVSDNNSRSDNHRVGSVVIVIVMTIACTTISSSNTIITSFVLIH